MSIKKKMYILVLTVGLLMMLSGYLNLFVVDYFIRDVKILMDDNFSGYQFKEALGNEVKCFQELMHNRTLENESIYKAASQETKRSLEELPFSFAQIGEERYAITWSIRNSYEQYCIRRDEVLKLQPDEESYIDTLYTVYSMQDYLELYSSRLNEAILTDAGNFYEQKIGLLHGMPYVLVGGSLFTFILLFFIVRGMTGNMLEALEGMVRISGQIAQNNYSAPDITWRENDEMGQLVHSFNKMKHATGEYIQTLEEMRQIAEKLYRQELEKVNLEQRFAAAQLQLLKSQMKPHFLFNTLNMITRMAQLETAPVTEEMLVALSNLLRYSLRTTDSFAPLYQELKVVQDYMYIQKKRFGERVQCVIDCRVDADREEIPVFLLQPLVENAMIHGICDKEDGGTVSIRIHREAAKMFLCVEDTGKGMTAEHLEQIREAIRERGCGLGIGLGNIYRRILAYYCDSELRVESTFGQGTQIFITLGERR